MCFYDDRHRLQTNDSSNVAPLYSLRDLITFSLISKECNQLMDPNSKRHRINFEVLFAEQGIRLTPTEVKESQIQTSKALKGRKTQSYVTKEHQVNFQYPTAQDLLQMHKNVAIKIQRLMYKVNTASSSFFIRFQSIYSNSVSSPVFSAAGQDAEDFK